MIINWGGFVPLSTIDWPGKAVSVVFFRGCPLTCPYCSNKELTSGSNYKDINVRELLKDCIPFIHGVVISGGEPLEQTLETAWFINQVAQTKRTKYAECNSRLKTAIETSGCYPERLRFLIEKTPLNTVFLDIKERFRDPDMKIATGVPHFANTVLASLAVVMKSGIPFQVRIPVFRVPGYPEMPTDEGLEEIKEMIEIYKNDYPENGYMGVKINKGIIPEGSYDGRKSIKPSSEGETL